WLAAKGIADIVLTDIIEGLPEGKALDIQQAGPIAGFDVRLAGSSKGYDETAGSAVVVITAGVPRKPGMTREQLIDTNAGILRQVIDQVVPRSHEAVFIILTNPLDAMTYLAYKVSGLTRQRVIGQSGALDTTRFRTFLAMELGVSVQDVDALVIGAHTDKDMVPLASLANVRGILVSSLLPSDRLDAVVARTRRGGAEITELMKQSGFTAAGASLVEMIEAVLLDRGRVIPCCVYLDGEYGERDLCIGVPVVVGAGGMSRVLEAPLSGSERAAFTASVAAVRELLAVLKL
ncbi:MAG TPA: malate dehydrogenase, partial [bacterium]|nr:malate dehydrogenase [bacterium]